MWGQIGGWDVSMHAYIACEGDRLTPASASASPMTCPVPAQGPPGPEAVLFLFDMGPVMWWWVSKPSMKRRAEAPTNQYSKRHYDHLNNAHAPLVHNQTPNGRGIQSQHRGTVVGSWLTWRRRPCPTHHHPPHTPMCIHHHQHHHHTISPHHAATAESKGGPRARSARQRKGLAPGAHAPHAHHCKGPCDGCEEEGGWEGNGVQGPRGPVRR